MITEGIAFLFYMMQQLSGERVLFAIAKFLVTFNSPTTFSLESNIKVHRRAQCLTIDIDYIPIYR